MLVRAVVAGGSRVKGKGLLVCVALVGGTLLLAGCGPASTRAMSTPTPRLSKANCSERGSATPLGGTPEPFPATGVSASSAQGTALLGLQGLASVDGVIAVVKGHFGDFDGDTCSANDGRAVWAVMMYGTFSDIGCFGPPHQPPSKCTPQHTAVGFVAYRDGTPLGYLVPAPMKYQPPPGWSPPQP